MAGLTIKQRDALRRMVEYHGLTIYHVHGHQIKDCVHHAVAYSLREKGLCVTGRGSGDTLLACITEAGRKALEEPTCPGRRSRRHQCCRYHHP